MFFLCIKKKNQKVKKTHCVHEFEIVHVVILFKWGVKSLPKSFFPKNICQKITNPELSVTGFLNTPSPPGRPIAVF